jgi:hypothetical protein
LADYRQSNELLDSSKQESRDVSGCDDDSNRRWVLVVYSVFGDESHDETKRRVFSVSGLFGTDKDWEDLVDAWVKRTGGKVFHAAACESDSEEFAGIDHSENLKLYADLTTILTKTNLLGYTATMNLADYSALFPTVFDPNDPYYFCFSNVIFHFVEVGYLSIPQDKVKFTFDQNLETDYNGGAIYNYMVHLPEWKGREYLADEVSFTSRKSPRIQAADLVAREGMKHMDNQISPTRCPARRSIAALLTTRRFLFRQLTRPFFEQLWKRAHEMRFLPGAKMSEYRAWLGKNGYTDNTSNRIRYQSYIDALLLMQSQHTKPSPVGEDS